MPAAVASRGPRRGRDHRDRPPPDALRRCRSAPTSSRSPPPCRRRPHRGRPGLRGDVPPRPSPDRRPSASSAAQEPLRARRQPRRGGRRRALERPRPRRRRGRRDRGRHRRRSPHRIRVTHFAEQIADHRRKVSDRSGRPRRRRGRRPRSRGALRVGRRCGGARRARPASLDRPAPGGDPACGAAEVVVLPNDGDTVRAAEIAARTAEAELGVSVEVIPTQAQVQGLAAVSVHEPGRGFDADVREMTATARHARHGAVTVAARRAITMAGPCEPGDALGVIAGDFAVVGSDLETVATDVLERLLAGGGELVAIVSGEVGSSSPQRVAAHDRAATPGRSTSRSAREASRATRCWSASSERPVLLHGRHHAGQPDRGGLRQPPQEAQARRGRSGAHHHRRPAAPLPPPLRRRHRALRGRHPRRRRAADHRGGGALVRERAPSRPATAASCVRRSG